MDRRFNVALNSEVTVYGLVLTGIVYGAIASFLAAICLGVIWAFSGSVPGYILGCAISKMMHTGELQRKLYWYLPGRFLLLNDRMPSSWQRWYL